MANSREEQEEQRKKQFAAKLYQDRFKLLKKGQELSAAGDVAKSVQFYSQYINALANYFGVDENKLSPKLFDKQKDISELFLISHVYWDLAKAYDRSPKLQKECMRCLNQYVQFTLGFKFQYVNARTLKNFIRKRHAHNPELFKEAYEKIQVESKACFISSDLTGNSSQTTNNLRLFKSFLCRSQTGIVLVAFYYEKLCPLYFSHNNKSLFKWVIKPLIFFSLTIISVPCSLLPKTYANH